MAKKIFHTLKNVLLDQGKQFIINSKEELLTKCKQVLKNVAIDKLDDIVSNNNESKKSVHDDTKTAEAQVDDHNIQDDATSLDTACNKQNTTQEVAEDEAYRNASQFEQKLYSGLQSLAVEAIKDPTQAAMVLNGMVEMAGEVAKFTEVQKTMRKEIEAEKDKYIAKIQSQKEIMLEYLEKTFDERKSNFDQLFLLVDKALAQNNTHALAEGLASINKLAASSPFKDLASIESTRKALEDDEHVWDI